MFRARLLPVSRVIGKRGFSTHEATQLVANLHELSGLPWWAFIPVTTFALRFCITTPLSIYQRIGLQKQNELRPITRAMSPIFKVKLAQASQDAQQKRNQLAVSNPELKFTPNPVADLNYEKITILAARERMKRQRALFKAQGVQTSKFMILPFFQIPLWVALSYLFRSITGWNDFTRTPLSQGGNFDPSLTHASWLHMDDLSLQDPYFISPIILGLAVLVNAEWNFKTGQMMQWTSSKPQLGQITRPKVFDSIMTLSRCGLMFLIAMSTQAPAALVWYWIWSNVYSLIQNVLLDKYLPLRFIPESRFRRFGEVSKDAQPLLKENTK